jgi:hypothetical protein
MVPRIVVACAIALCTTVLCALSTQNAYAAGPIFVKPAASSSGSSWANAASLQQALAIVDTGAYGLQALVPLTVTIAGAGRIDQMPAGQPCDAPCRGLFTPGTVVTLTASGFTTTLFSHWSGACTGPGDPPATCVVTMNTAKSVTATFESATGSVQGMVQDAQKHGLAGVIVTLTLSDTAAASSAQPAATAFTQTTNSSGNYLFTDVPSGSYILNAHKAGYDPATPQGVFVSGGQSKTVPTITLQATQASKPEMYLPLLGNHPK